MNAIKYTRGVEGDVNFCETCDPEAYENKCQTYNCFEAIPDDRKVKAYFDIEIKPSDCVDGVEYIDCWAEVIQYGLKFIEKRFPNAEYCFKNQSSPEYANFKNGKTGWITSVHIIVWNYVVSKPKLKSIVIEMNQEINKHILNKNDCSEKVSDFYELGQLKYVNGNKEGFTLFDESVYNKKRKIRSAYADKTHDNKMTGEILACENRPSKIEFGTFQQSVISAFIPEDAMEIPDDPIDDSDTTSESDDDKPKSKTNTKTVYQKLEELKQSNHTNNQKKIIFFMENGFDKCCKCHEDIVKIGYSIAKEFGIDGLPLFQIFAEKYTSQPWSQAKKEYDDKYDSLLKNNNGKCGFGTIYWIFKKYDEKLYKKISKIWNTEHYEVDMIYNLCYTGATADYFKNLYGDFICACDGVAYIYNGIRWEKCDDKNSELVRFIDKVFYKDLIEYGNIRMTALIEMLKNSSKEESELLNDKIKDVSKYLKNVNFNMRNSGCRKGYISDIIDFSTNNNIKFDSDKHLFAFNNKIYDLENQCFIEPEPSQYISKSCGYDYDDNYDTKYKTDLTKVIDSVFPNKEIKEYYLTFLATGLSGIHMEEFMIATGVGGNGKSMINGLMMTTIGDYGYEVPSICFTKEIKDGPNAELARLNGVRFALTSEPDSKKKFSCSAIKSITGNETLPVRLLHSNQVGIDLVCSLVCEANDVPDFDEVNQAVNRRVRASVFETIALDKCDYDKLDEDDKACGKYTIKKPEYKTTEFKTKHRQALFMILCNYFKTFKENGYALNAMPAKCKSKVVSLFAASDGIYSWFEELYQPVASEVYLTSQPIPVSDIYEKFSSSPYFMRLPKTEQRKLTRKHFVEKITTNLFLQKFLKLRKTYWNKTRLDWDAIIGWELKPDDNENDNALDEE